MNRRTVLSLAAVGAVAAGAGLYTALSRPGAPAASAPPRPAGGPPAVAGDLWTLAFERPGGGELQMRALFGRPTLVNFWATWCPPCVKELPMLDATHGRRGERGLQVVGLAVDGPTPVREFLARSPVSFDIGLAGLTGVELGRALGNATGGLPFTVILDRAGQIVDRRLGALTQDDLDRWEREHAV